MTLSILGLLAGLVTDGGLWWSQGGVVATLILPGIFFGIAISLYFYKKPIYEIITFVILSGTAYFAAYFVTFFIGGCAICGFSDDTMTGGTIATTLPGPFHLVIANFIGGMVGAAILSAVFIILSGKIYGRFGIWPLVLWGGILAIIGFVPGLFIGSAYNNNYIQSFYFLFPVWQFGMALALSYYIKKAENSAITRNNASPQIEKETPGIQQMF